tara:strand:+ start:3544 stop:4371 length:828 start_codon:yes stop_codon:yes gene_type:complete
MSQLYVDNIKNRTGGAIGAPSGVVVTGVVTATSFSGNGSGLIGVASTDNIITGTAATFNNTVNFGSVCSISTSGNSLNINSTDTISISGYSGGTKLLSQQGSDLVVADAVGGDVELYFVTSSGANGSEKRLETTTNGIAVVGIVTASSGIVTYYGDGSQLTGIEVGITTTASSPTANSVVTLDLSSAQHHELNLSAGITTITCSGGSIGDSHSVLLIQPTSGIATVGFSTYFLFPSGATPAMSEGGGKIDLLSFVTKQVGAGGTQLLASAGLNYQ